MAITNIHITIYIIIYSVVSCHRISNKQELEKAVAEIANWKALCEYLGIPMQVTNQLHFSNEHNGRLRGECLEIYLSTGKACWEQVVKVVADHPFRNTKLANKIADMYSIYYYKDEL